MLFSHVVQCILSSAAAVCHVMQCILSAAAVCHVVQCILSSAAVCHVVQCIISSAAVCHVVQCILSSAAVCHVVQCILSSAAVCHAEQQESSWSPSTRTTTWTSTAMTPSMLIAAKTWPTWTPTFSPWQKRPSRR